MSELEETVEEDWKIVIVPNKVDIPNKFPRKRKVFIEKAQEFAEKKNVLFYGEWSAFQNLNIQIIIEKLCQEIYEAQSKLIKKGVKKIEGLKITREEKDHMERNKNQWWK